MDMNRGIVFTMDVLMGLSLLFSNSSGHILHIHDRLKWEPESSDQNMKIKVFQAGSKPRAHAQPV